MRKPSHVCFAAFFAIVGFHLTPALGGVAFLKSTGSGTTCTADTPCKVMGSVLTAAGPGGEVVCLDKGHYSVAVISQSVTISCGEEFWECPSGFIDINTPAGSDVVIEGLVMDGVGVGGGNITFTGQGSLRLRRVRIGNTVPSGSSSHGVTFAPGGGATLTVSDSVFYHNGGSGINVRPTSGGYANVHIRNSTFERNAHGIFVDGSASSIGINVNISESMAVENQGNGIGAYSPAGGAPVTISVKDSHISGNLTNGLGVLAAAASGAGSAAIAVASTMITANVNGVSTGGTGQARTHGNNQVQFNSNNGAFTANVSLQ